MKKIICTCLLGILSFASAFNAASAGGKDKVIKILAIGNSFSVDALEQHFYDLAKAEGINVIVGNMYIGGCNLQRHLNNALEDKPAYSYRKIGLDGKMAVTKGTALSYALADEEWDYISFQQQSGKSGLYETWIESLPALLAYVKERVPASTVMMLHQTWAYDPTSTHRDFKNYNNLPGAEGIVFIGDELHILYESGALSNFDDLFNKLTWNQFIKDCTDVIWRIDENDLSQTVQIENTGLGHRIQSILAKFLELMM